MPHPDLDDYELPTPSVQFQTRFPTQTYRRLREAAVREGVTRTRFINRAVLAYLEANHADTKSPPGAGKGTD